MAKAYSQRPSIMLGLDPSENEWLCYQVDSAAWIFGTWVDGKLAERTEPVKSGKKKGQTQPKYKLDDLLADPATRQATRQQEAQQRRQQQHRSVRALLPAKITQG